MYTRDLLTEFETLPCTWPRFSTHTGGRRAALRRWTLINAEAKMFVPTPPEQDGNVDFGEEEEEEEEEEDKEEEDGGKKKKEDDDKDDDEDEDEKEEVPVKASIKHQPTSSSSSLLSKSK